MSPRAAEEPSAQVSVPGTTCLPWGNDRGNWTADSVICVCVWFVCVQISLCVCTCVCFCPLTPPCIPPILSLLVKNILRHKTTGKSWAEECLHQRPLTLWYSLSMLHVEKHNFLSECEVKEAKREKLHLKTPYCDVKGKILELNKPPNSDSKIFFLFFFLNLFVFQGAVRGIHEPLGQLCFKFGQPCPLWEQQPVAGHAVGGAAEAPSSGAIVWSFQGRPGSHEVVETLLQVSRRVQKVGERSRGVTLLRYCVMFHSLSQALCSLREVLYYYSSYWLYHSPLCCCSDEACTSGQLVIASRESQYKILHFHHAGLDKLAEVFQQWKCCRETQLKDQVGLQPKFPVWLLVLLEKEAFFLTVFIQL